MDSNSIVTLSRQYGSGGRKIGEQLACRLGIPFYDKELIALAAQQSGVSEEFFTQPEKSSYLLRNFSLLGACEETLSDKVYLAQRAVLCKLAQQGPCVIVGRGAGSILKDEVPLLNVFVYADLALRRQRAIEEYGASPHKIEEHIHKIDKKRAAYFHFYTGTNGVQMENYHLCLDSGLMGLETVVNVLETAYRGQ